MGRKKKTPEEITMGAIRAANPDKWIVVKVTKSDRGGSPTHGIVLSTHDDRSAAYKALVVGTDQVVEYGDPQDEEERIDIVYLELEGATT